MKGCVWGQIGLIQSIEGGFAMDGAALSHKCMCARERGSRQPVAASRVRQNQISGPHTQTRPGGLGMRPGSVNATMLLAEIAIALSL